MREIEFRGIVRLDNRVNRYWKYGTLMRDTAGDYAIGEIEIGKVVIPDRYSYVETETIGQYIGLRDKNGVKIFEGDIVSVWTRNGTLYEVRRGDIIFKNLKWSIGTKTEYLSLHNEAVYLESLQTIEVIGNIHDNPELLEEASDG